MGERISNCHSFESCQESSCFFGFNDLLGDGRNVFSSIALSEYDQGTGGRNVKIKTTEASLTIV
jgi:hypothetical protein